MSKKFDFKMNKKFDPKKVRATVNDVPVNPDNWARGEITIENAFTTRIPFRRKFHMNPTQYGDMQEKYGGLWPVTLTTDLQTIKMICQVIDAEPTEDNKWILVAIEEIVE